MQIGTVKFFNKSKGYGFIICGSEEIFVHISGLTCDNLNEGDEVKFDTEQGKKGICAINVSKV